MMLWNPSQHSDQENLQWCWLRAVEWANWPLFLSLPIGPPLLIEISVWQIIVVLVVLDLLWLGVRYRVVSVRLSSIGAVYSLLRWVTIPAAAIALAISGRWLTAVIAILWPSLIGVVGGITRPQIGRIQVVLMRQLGYEPTPENPLSEHWHG